MKNNPGYESLTDQLKNLKESLLDKLSHDKCAESEEKYYKYLEDKLTNFELQDKYYERLEKDLNNFDVPDEYTMTTDGRFVKNNQKKVK